MSAEHPILARYAQLRAQWCAYLEHAHARLLVWQATPDELSLLHSFLAGGSDLPEAERGTPVAVALTTPFADLHAHGRLLAAELRDQAVPKLGTTRSDAQPSENGRAQLCAALVTLHESQRENSASPLTVWLAPENVHDVSAYHLWLRALAREAPARLRFVVLEDPFAGDSALRDHACICVRACALDMPEALRALARQADDGGDGGRYRLLLLELAAAVTRRDAPAAERLAQAATELAMAAGWPSLAAAAQMALGTARAALADPLGALRAYVAAEPLAVAAAQGEHAQGAALHARSGERLRLSACLGQAAQLLALQAHREAAERYAACAQLACRLPDLRLTLDAHRLAAGCLVAAGALAEAWEHAMAGVAAAERMDVQLRASSTLPYLAAQLRALAQRGMHGVSREALSARLHALTGAGLMP